jgi:hypothetical protein
MRFACPCGATFTATIYQVVNVTLEPRLLYRLLEGTLNVAECPNCGRKAEAAQPFFYHDMQRSLFAYVHPSADLPEEEREALLEQLRRSYTLAVEESERIARRGARQVQSPRPTVRRSRPYDDIGAKLEPEAPPMQVIFGTGRLVTLVDSLLEPAEKLGRVALNARGAAAGAQERLLTIARGMADQMDCDTAVEDEPDGFTVWIYGPRARVDAITRALGQGA